METQKTPGEIYRIKTITYKIIFSAIVLAVCTIAYTPYSIMILGTWTFIGPVGLLALVLLSPLLIIGRFCSKALGMLLPELFFSKYRNKVKSIRSAKAFLVVFQIVCIVTVTLLNIYTHGFPMILHGINDSRGTEINIIFAVLFYIAFTYMIFLPGYDATEETTL